MTHLRIQFPTRGRPKQFLEILSEYLRLMSGPPDIQVIMDVDDDTMTDDVVQQIQANNGVCMRKAANPSKIAAVNCFAGEGAWDVLLLASDDMWPVVQGYDEIIRKNMDAHFTDLDGVLWFNDGYQENRLNTLSILGRAYYRRFGYIYHPDYKSMYCDNEFMEVAESLNRQVYFPEMIIEHRHPASGKAPGDPVYQRNQIPQGSDCSIYVRRKRAGFPQESIL